MPVKGKPRTRKAQLPVSKLLYQEPYHYPAGVAPSWDVQLKMNPELPLVGCPKTRDEAQKVLAEAAQKLHVLENEFPREELAAGIGTSGREWRKWYLLKQNIVSLMVHRGWQVGTKNEPSHEQNTPEHARKRPHGRIPKAGSPEAGRLQKLKKIIGRGSEGPQYCREVDRDEIKPPKKWIDLGWPGSYEKANYDLVWQKRIQREKWLAKKGLV